MANGGKKRAAKQHYNCISDPIFNIPISQVCAWLRLILHSSCAPYTVGVLTRTPYYTRNIYKTVPPTRRPVPQVWFATCSCILRNHRNISGVSEVHGWPENTAVFTGWISTCSGVLDNHRADNNIFCCNIWWVNTSDKQPYAAVLRQKEQNDSAGK